MIEGEPHRNFHRKLDFGGNNLDENERDVKDTADAVCDNPTRSPYFKQTKDDLGSNEATFQQKAEQNELFRKKLKRKGEELTVDAVKKTLFQTPTKETVDADATLENTCGPDDPQNDKSEVDCDSDQDIFSEETCLQKDKTNKTAVREHANTENSRSAQVVGIQQGWEN